MEYLVIVNGLHDIKAILNFSNLPENHNNEVKHQRMTSSRQNHVSAVEECCEEVVSLAIPSQSFICCEGR